ncbi:MAG: hypothetical protein A3F26_00660 [Candidatus Ryanbacteria bacterium RIFCSPHIGHO2_12_FULL_47_12b]|uniref:General secretion pathway GspH domain-containing protein n=2 Tax=Candidatus Ryaniibacteriota TaxID=1817914 RepID=A0A1G2H6I0_9BACT|nr:MAG: hypothetical protein UX74_C0010G0019 [Parcubacteria group bacterium GW2011_GWA2_47_10b]KKU85530.1 MAG: hypothetical protein UY14_C0021G0006 [Parcubacteria group bacterium GW2011_GWA1_47_9]OGZ45141.1 MAG: hypothetical protein A2844_00675 [Candidatus Ryanbacteria bacterium RIFCSPHIGHO2_01_FULL_48_80]OGZ51249.1 MAG: hypothetical protein A3F26_00660 [Candidatus Ryanbacteria bacterium RIFCSPHIGHO2_12_FULL_47_12b]OGZ53079.1 MAG: hypothetical protein A3A29_02290 [Candidatus Ryanbacteria bacter
MKRGGFNLAEVLVVMALLGLIFAIVIAGFSAWRTKTTLRATTRDIESTLKLARSKSLASEGGVRYGVLFSNQTTPHRYILCKDPQLQGSTYVCLTDFEISRNDLPVNVSFCKSPGHETLVRSGSGTAPPTPIFAKLSGAYENISGGAADGYVVIYNKSEILGPDPCEGDMSVIDSCISSQTCAAVKITRDGVVYERTSSTP